MPSVKADWAAAASCAPCALRPQALADVQRRGERRGRLLGGLGRQPGRRLGDAQAVVGMLENPATRPVVLARIRSASSHEEAAALVRELVSRDVGLLTRALTDDRPEIRAVLVGTQIVGLAFSRYVVAVEPIASLAPPELMDVLAPTFQRLLVGPLTD